MLIAAGTLWKKQFNRVLVYLFVQVHRKPHTYGGLMGRTQTVSDFLTVMQSLGKEIHADRFMFVNRIY